MRVIEFDPGLTGDVGGSSGIVYVPPSYYIQQIKPREWERNFACILLSSSLCFGIIGGGTVYFYIGLHF